ncbi:MAG: hypothetical protein LBE78_13690 [Burkholderiaceae bacterium]|jgi:hypothetical protein|nr:hypothetical protein [Burkholderiaceae bacterium]
MASSNRVTKEQAMARHEQASKIIADCELQHEFKLPKPWRGTIGTLLLNGLNDPSLQLIFETLAQVELEAGRMAKRSSPTAAQRRAQTKRTRERTCLKCDYVNPTASGSRTETCPACGAIYAESEHAEALRMEALAAKQAVDEAAEAREVRKEAILKWRLRSK